MPERYAVTHLRCITIWTSVDERFRHALDARFIFADESCYTTHSDSIVECTFSCVSMLLFRYYTSSMATTHYSVIVPALNEEGAIGALIDQLRALPIEPEIIVVDGGSTDATLRIAREKGVRILAHPAPAGYGKSIKDGMKIASHDTIVVIDADGTYPVAKIPDLLTQMEKGYDMVVGARHGKQYRGKFLKMPARMVLRWIVESVTGQSIPDINSGLRVFRRSDALAIFDHICNGFSFLTTITLIYMLTGKFVSYIPIDYYERIGHTKVRIVRDSLRTLQYILEVVALYNPLPFFLMLSAILGVFVVLSLFAFAVIDAGYIVLTAFFFIASIIVFCFGLVAHTHSIQIRRRS